MNETVAKIVELLFQDVEMNDEVRAIHDEVMNNCQERFGDLINRGLSEDEAIAAVVESLKGMEEVLAGYPRKAAEPQTAEPQAAGYTPASGDMTFSAEGLRNIAVSLINEDVTLEPSMDGQVHVLCDEDMKVCVELVNGELRVNRQDDHEKKKTVHADFTANVKDGKFQFRGDGVKFDEGHITLDGIGKLINNVMRGLQISFDTGDRVRIQAPADLRLERVSVHTTSGDVAVEGLLMNELEIESRSGDMRVELSNNNQLAKVAMHTISGDMEAWLAAHQAVMQSISGDARFVGRAGTLTISSTSGDVTVECVDGSCGACEARSVSGDVECTGYMRFATVHTTSGDVELAVACEEASFGTVSGDVHVSLRGGELRRIEGHTTSGDVTITLPEHVRGANLDLRTRSGEISQSVANVGNAPVYIAVNTMSGDIRVC